MNNETISSNGISAASLVDYVNRVLNLGLDVHYRQVTVAMQEDGGRIKAAGKMGHVDFLNWAQKKLLEGWQIYSCYEAGASGYWLHRELEQLGVKNLVVVPKAMGQGGKKQKTDKRDAGELCDRLDRYLRGQDRALSVVAVPREDQEEKRALIRYHRQIMADRGRCEARGKGLLCAQGIEVHGRWWQGAAWLEVQSDPRLKDWMKEPLWYRDCALDFGGDGMAPDNLATAVSTGASLSGWLGQRQTRQETLGRSSGTAFSD